MKLNELWQRLFPGKLKQKGALFVEYGMILAFVIVVGVVLVGDKTMSSNVNSIFDKTAQMLGLAAEGKDGEKKQAVDWAASSYKDMGAGVKAQRSDDMLALLEQHHGFISSTDAEGIAALKAAGISVDEGGGNWVLQTINGGQGYEYTWTQEDTSNTKAGDTVTSVSYRYDGPGQRPMLTMGTAQVDANGIVNTGTTLKNDKAYFSYANDDVKFEANYGYAMDYVGWKQ